MRTRSFKEWAIEHTCGLFAASVPVLLVIVIVVVGVSAWPSIRYNGWHFFVSISWNRGNLYSGATTTRHGFAAALVLIAIVLCFNLVGRRILRRHTFR